MGDMRQELYDNCIKALMAQNYDLGLDYIRHIYAENHDEGRDMARRYRVTMKKVLKRGGDWAVKAYDLIRESYLMSARDCFDDFMTAIEYYRAPDKAFWQPRRKWLKEVCDALQELEEGELDELFLSMPPRVGKSTLALFFMVWVMCRDSERTNIYSSYSKDVTDTFFNGVVEILTDNATYGVEDVFPSAKIASTNAEKGFINIERKKRLNTLVTRSISMGLNGLADASGYIVIDDIHSGIIEARNPDLLLGTWQVVNNNLLSRKKDQTKFLWIGTRWSVYDAISQRLELLETSPELANRRYKVVNVPALNENDESNFNYPFGLGFSTNSYKETRAAFEKSDDMPSWLAQYMGAPIERNGAVFSPDALRYYNGELPEEDPDRILMVVDPSWGGGDYVSAPCFYQYGEELYLHDLVFTNKDKFISEPQIVECAVRNNVGAMYVEGTRVTGTYAEELDKRFRGIQYRLNLQRTTKHWASQSGKAQRIFDKAPEIISKVVFRDSKHRDKTYQQFMQQLFTFTVEGRVRHDDAADSLAMAMVLVSGRMYAKARTLRRVI